MVDLDKARQAINEADREMARLFEQRMDAVRRVAEYKKEHGLPVEDTAREEHIVRKNAADIRRRHDLTSSLPPPWGAWFFHGFWSGRTPYRHRRSHLPGPRNCPRRLSWTSPAAPHGAGRRGSRPPSGCRWGCS